MQLPAGFQPQPQHGHWQHPPSHPSTGATAQAQAHCKPHDRDTDLIASFAPTLCSPVFALGTLLLG